MTDSVNAKDKRKDWIEPEVTELSVSETSARPGRGADVGGNPAIDCQRS